MWHLLIVLFSLHLEICLVLALMSDYPSKAGNLPIIQSFGVRGLPLTPWPLWRDGLRSLAVGGGWESRPPHRKGELPHHPELALFGASVPRCPAGHAKQPSAPYPAPGLPSPRARVPGRSSRQRVCSSAHTFMLLGIQRLSVEDFVQRLPGRIHAVLVPRVSLYFPDRAAPILCTAVPTLCLQASAQGSQTHRLWTVRPQPKATLCVFTALKFQSCEGEQCEGKCLGLVH